MDLVCDAILGITWAALMPAIYIWHLFDKVEDRRPTIKGT